MKTLMIGMILIAGFAVQNISAAKLAEQKKVRKPVAVKHTTRQSARTNHTHLIHPPLHSHN